LVDVDKFASTPIRYQEEKTDTLTDGEMAKLCKVANDMLMAIPMMQLESEDAKSTCGNLIEYYFADMCKILDFSSPLCEEIQNRYKDEREKNNKIRQNEKLLGETLQPDEIIDIMKKMSDEIGNRTAQEICFDVSDFKIDKYGITELQFRYITSNFDCLRNGMSEEMLYQTFDMSQGSRAEESLYLLDTTRNKEIISRCIKKINPSAEIRTVDVQQRHGEFIINKFSIYIHNLMHIPI
jgi:hypothetical protein